MDRVTHNPIPRFPLVGSFLLVLPLAVMACGSGDSPSVISAAEARAVATTPVEPKVTAKPETDVTSPSREEEPPVVKTFETAYDAYSAGEYRVATAMYRTKVDSAPADAHGQYMLGLSSWKSGDFTAAKEAFDKAIEIDPAFVKAYFNQARVLLDLDRVPEALEVIQMGRTIDSASPEGLRLVARAQAEGGDVDGAIATYHELLTRDEADEWGLNNLGMLLFEGGDIEGSLGPLARAVQVRPTAPVFLNNLGMALEKSGHPVAALNRYELAVRHDSTYHKAVRNVERLTALVTDSTRADEVNVGEIAERFRQEVRLWKVETPVVPVPAPEVTVPTVEVPLP